MGSTTTTELGLDVSAAFVKKMGGAGAGAAKMEDYVRRLEEERRKIDAFKRELPLCMLILTDVIAHVREELTAEWGDDEIGNESRPAVVLEQFLPIRDDGEAEKIEKKKNSSRVEKMNWMSSVQLWSDAYSDESNTTHTHHRRSNSDERIGGEPDRQSESSKSDGGGGGGFLLTLPAPAPVPAPVPALCSDLSLLTPGLRTSVSGEEHRSCGSSSQGVKAAAAAATATATANVSPASHAQSNSQQQCPRKARRCWSPELHRRFLGALQQLGGSQAATPKQIRELMKVDGLTNDEVKSHLQKYRLHTRRVDQSMVVYGGGAGGGGGGGLWSSSSQPPAPVMQQHRNSPSESPQSPLHFKGGEDDAKSESFNWRGGKAHRASSNKERS